MKAIELEKNYNSKKIENEISFQDENFCNKVWKTSRYILGSLEGRNLIPICDADLNELDKWIYIRLNNAICNSKDQSFVFSYFSADFCDWYVEAVKLSFKNGDASEKDRAISVLFSVFEESLRLIYPFFPVFVEEIYSKLPLNIIIENRKLVEKQKIISNDIFNNNLVNALKLMPNDFRKDIKIENCFKVIDELICEILALRVDCGMDPVSSLHIALKIQDNPIEEIIKEHIDLIALLSNVYKIDFLSLRPEKTISWKNDCFEIFVFIEDGINKDQIIAKCKKEIELENLFIQKSEIKLSGKFSQNAPKDVVEELKNKVELKKLRVEKLQSYIDAL